MCPYSPCSCALQMNVVCSAGSALWRNQPKHTYVCCWLTIMRPITFIISYFGWLISRTTFTASDGRNLTEQLLRHHFGCFHLWVSLHGSDEWKGKDQSLKSKYPNEELKKRSTTAIINMWKQSVYCSRPLRWPWFPPRESTDDFCPWSRGLETNGRPWPIACPRGLRSTDRIREKWMRATDNEGDLS